MASDQFPLLKELLGDVFAGASGVTTPTQANSLGIPRAAGLTPDQLQMLLTMPQRQLQMQQMQQIFPAKLENMQAQTQQRLAAANKPLSSYGSLDELVDGLHQWAASGGTQGTPLDALPGFGVNSLKGQAMAAWSKKYPQDARYITKAEIGYKAGQAGAQSEARGPNSPAMFKIRALANAQIPQYDAIEQAAKAVSSGDIKAINRIKAKLGYEFSDKNWSNLRNRARTLADEFQNQLGQGSDKKLDLARSLVDEADSLPVLLNAVQILKEVAKSRAIASTGKVPTLEQITGTNVGDPDKLLDKYGVP